MLLLLPRLLLLLLLLGLLLLRLLLLLQLLLLHLLSGRQYERLTDVVRVSYVWHHCNDPCPNRLLRLLIRRRRWCHDRKRPLTSRQR